MALPEKILVKISSEAAGYISITPVNRQELAPSDLIGRILAVTGKKPARIRDILSRGSIVSGSSRYRWEPVETAAGELETLLRRFPDDAPDRPFEPAQCFLAVLRGRRGNCELQREVASQRRLFKKASFWDELMSVLPAEQLQYHQYSYAEAADIYTTAISRDTLQALLEKSSLLKYGSLAQEIHVLEPDSADLYTKRSPDQIDNLKRGSLPRPAGRIDT